MALLIFVGIAALVFCTDVLLKQGIEETFLPGEERKLIGERVLLRKIYNKGAMLNLLAGRPDILKGISALLGAAALLYDAVLLGKPRRFLKKTGMMLFTGGAFSNIFDRFLRGKVIDYIGFQTRWHKLTEITYNLADFAIFIGTTLVMISRFVSFVSRKLCFVQSIVKRTPSPDQE